VINRALFVIIDLDIIGATATVIADWLSILAKLVDLIQGNFFLAFLADALLLVLFVLELGVLLQSYVLITVITVL
jgi:hypothetical protein